VEGWGAGIALLRVQDAWLITLDGYNEQASRTDAFRSWQVGYLILIDS
jgi:hypothetical protein